jgi:hypothetical protein
MSKKLIILAFAVFLIFYSPTLSIAQNVSQPDTNEPDLTLPNPLGTTNVSVLAARIIRAVLGLVGVFALVMFIYGGVLWMSSGGNEEMIKKGKDTLVWAVLGLALIFFSYAVLDFIFRVILKVGV